MKSQSFSERELWRKYIKIVLVVTLYWIISISTVFVNKTLLSSTTINLNAPLFVTWTQCVISTLICIGLSVISDFFPNIVQFPKSTPFASETIKNVLPLSFLFILMIGFNNLCLTYVGVSFYFLSRSLTTVFNVIFTYLILNVTTSRNAIFCCILIIIGFFLGIDQENFIGSFSLTGTIYGVLGSLSLSLYSIHTKKILKSVDNHILLLSYYNNLYSSILFLPLILLNGEFKALSNYDFNDSSFWMLITIGGIFGFSIGFVTTLQIQVTSPLTHNISGTAKACAQTVIATYWYNEVKPFLWWFSNFVVLFASAAYARIKQLEMAKEHNKRPLSA